MPWWRFVPCRRHYRDPHRSSLKTVAEEDQNLHRVSHEYVQSAGSGEWVYPGGGGYRFTMTRVG
jgi:hypothetical protein